MITRRILALAFLLAAALPVSAQSVPIFTLTKAQTFAITKQVRDVTGKLKTVTVARYGSWGEVVEASRKLPRGPKYRVTVPSPYLALVPCEVPPGSLCGDMVDSRLIP